ncbi:MAG TPA: hypothetical protein VKB10_02955 [Gaiellaceae bacterium]|nr:hypothetical protein [Gaiellaceae bacterium]
MKEDDRPYLLARSLPQAISEQERVMKKLALGLAAAALLAISAGTATTAPASAAPIIIRDTVTSPIFETGLTDDCRPGLTGTIVGTDVLSFQSVETANGSHTHGTFVDTGRIDWSDGSYTLIHAVDHFSFNGVGHGTAVFTETHTDAGDFFSAATAGVFEFRQTFHEVQHFTVTKGVVRADVNKGHFHFFGDC